MKKLFTFFALSFITLSQSQTAINSFYSIPNSSFGIIDPNTVINQTSGTNQTWNFTNLVKVGESVDTYTTPTSQETSSYPGTTSVLTVNSTVNLNTAVTKFYTKNNSNQISFTAVKNPEFELNYDTNNALIGTFPINYGFSNSDPISGNYVYSTYLGTFSGTITSNFDAYGTLSTNDIGFGPFSGNVSRLKIVQNLNLNYGAIPNVGTVSQTTYNYYDSSNGYLVFRYSTINISVPLLSLNETSTSIENFQTILLSRVENELNNSIVLFPNPIKSEFDIQNTSGITIESVRILDLQGKEILKTNTDEKINLSDLSSGIYLAAIETEKGIINKKIIKE